MFQTRWTMDAVSDGIGAPFLAAGGVFAIERPLLRVVDDVLAEGVELALIPDDLFLVVPLPEMSARGIPQLVDPFGRYRLERADQAAQRLSSRPHVPCCRGGSRTALALRTAPVIIMDDDNPMQMVGHHHPRIQRNVRVLLF